jgi:GGDEF domain-containing protein
MLKKSGTTKSLPRLPSTPGLADIHAFLQRALEHRGTAIEICWTPMNGLSEYSLAVECTLRGGDAEWRMYAGSGSRSQLLWNYVSCDVLLVYNLVCSSCGDGFNTVTTAAEPVSDTWRESGSGQDTFYRLEALNVPKQEPLVPLTLTQENAALLLPKPTSALTGDLAHVQMPTLLQSILMAQMNGRLKILSNNRNAEVFFKDGIPVHSFTTDTVGEESIFEILTWKEGDFSFEAKVTTDARTIKQNLDSLLLQGMQLIDNATYLRNSGLRPETLMQRKYKNLSERDFESMVASGAPIPMLMQKKFYRSIDDNKTVQNLLEKLRLPRSQWIPLMCNMMRCDLLSLSQSAGAAKSARPALEPKSIDKRAIQNVMMSLRRPETGLFTYPAFLYFLEQEYFRGYRSASPISIVVFQMRMRSGNLDPVREPLPIAAVSEAVRRISRVKRHVDMMAHYETFDYALLLPNTKTSGAAIFANRIMKTLTASPLLPGMDMSKLSFAFGIASIPEDFLDLSLLLSAAEVAKNAAMNSPAPIVLYKDIK